MIRTIHLPELKAEADAWEMICKEQHWPFEWHPEQRSPRPEWHGRQVMRIGYGVFRFSEEKSPTYHLIKDSCLV